VTSSPTGISCPSDCDADYISETTVSLTAVPSTDQEFAGWGGDSDCSDGQMMMDRDKRCTSTFNFKPRLEVTKTGPGSGRVVSNPAGIDCGTDCEERYPSGTEVSLVATPEADSVFERWEGDADCADGRFLVTADRSCTATFLEQFTLPVSVQGRGTVTSSPEGIECPGDCAGDYTSGTTVALIPTPARGWRFSGWSGACHGTGACMVTMMADQSVKATFKRNSR